MTTAALRRLHARAHRLRRTPQKVTPPRSSRPPAASITPARGRSLEALAQPASTTTRLVLDLVGPAGVKTRGVGSTQGPGLKFAAFENGLPINDTGVYQLHAATGDEAIDRDHGGLKPGNVVTVGIFQKDRAQTAQDSGAALCQIALVFDPKASVLPGACWR